MNNIFSDVPNEIPEEIFQTLIENKHIKIERIISAGHKSPKQGWYDQKDNEWVIVLRGHAKIEFESGDEHSLIAGDYLNIAAHCKHRVSWTAEDEETIWLAVFY